MVLVADENGFEIPVIITELVKVDPTNAGGRFFEERFREPENLKNIKNVKNMANEENGGNEDREENEAETGVSSLPGSLTRARKSEEIYLAFVPHDQKWMMTGPVDVLLINNTSCDLLYNLFHKTALGHYEGVDYGSVFADSRLLLATVNRENLARWSDGSLQFLFHRQQSENVLPPFNSDFRIDGKKFFKEGNYRDSTLAGGKAIVVKILSLDQYLAPKPVNKPSGPDPKGQVATGSPFIRKHQVSPREAEVDLHIHELLEDPVNLEKSEILDYQKDYFLKCLDSAVTEGYLKLTVIHGVGNGVLRTSLMDLMKNYRGIEILDAPMSKYGVGAIEIRIPHNRD
jgi:hypothetical protein